MAEAKYIKVGENGSLISVEDCYSYIYDSGNGRTVLRIKIKDTNITVDEILKLFNNAINNPIYEYKFVTQPTYSVPEENPEPVAPAEPVYELVSVHEDYCKEMSYQYANHEFSIEIIKKLAEEKLSDEIQETNNEIMMVVTDLYSL